VDAVRTTDHQRFAVLLGTRHDRSNTAVETLEQQAPGLADLERERGVDDVGGGEPVVEEPTLLAELLGHGVDERRHVVVRLRLDRGDPLGAGSDRMLGDLVDGVPWHGTELGPAFERRELHLEPACELRLVRPDPGHGRAGVARDHDRKSRGDTGAPSPRDITAYARPEAASAMSVR
jgi:hypothetical protein